jgi:spermidine synthase
MNSPFGNFGARDLDLWIHDLQGNSGYAFKIQQHLYHKKTEYQTIDVVQSQDFGNILLIDGAVMITDRDEFMYHEMITHVPCFAHGNVQKALVVGGGDGGVLRELCRHKSLKEATLVEIDEAVLEVSRQFFPQVAQGLDHSKANVVIQDGALFFKEVQEKQEKYDLIITDSTDPYGPSEALFQQDFYRTVRDSLSEGGLFVAQTESAFFNAQAIELIYKNLSSIFEYVDMYWAPIPTYPGGGWTFCLCSTDPGFQPHISKKGFSESLGKELQYYNQDIHQGSFTLPQYMKKTVEPYLTRFI